MPEPPRILVVRLSALGDVLATLPAFAHLRATLPGARFAWAVEAPFAPLLEDLPGLDETFLFRTKRWRKNLLATETRTALLRSFDELRSFRPDVAIDFQGTLKSAAVTRFSGASTRIGLGPGELRERGAALAYADRAQGIRNEESPAAPLRALRLAAHVVARLTERAESAGPDPPPRPFALHVPSDPEGRVASFVATLDAPFVLLQPGAGWRNKEWGAARFGTLAERLRSERGWIPVVGWGPGEEPLAREVVETSKGTARLAPPTGIRELAFLASQAQAMVGGDTGPVHLAAGLGVPTVGILGPTGSRRHAPWGPRTKVVELPLDCRPCERRFSDRKPCLERIDVESVMASVIELAR